MIIEAHDVPRKFCIFQKLSDIMISSTGNQNKTKLLFLVSGLRVLRYKDIRRLLSNLKLTRNIMGFNNHILYWCIGVIVLLLYPNTKQYYQYCAIQVTVCKIAQARLGLF